jgi:formamidopyrimidine-DNA glycosylase
VLKTFTPPPDALVGAPVDGVERHGKFLDLDCGGTHLVVHLARAGWLRWSDTAPSGRLRPGKSPIAVRVRFDDGSGFDLTEAGTQKRLAAYVVNRVADVPGIASLGPDPLADSFTEADLATILAAHRMQVKGLLRDQSILAGVGNAYSDEILHVAKLSPFALAATLDAEQVARLYAAMRETLARAVAAASGKPAAELKDAKRAGMRVHGRTGEACPECGDVVREVSFADSSLQYCATCQTGGKLLADRRTSRFLK